MVVLVHVCILLDCSSPLPTPPCGKTTELRDDQQYGSGLTQVGGGGWRTHDVSEFPNRATLEGKGSEFANKNTLRKLKSPLFICPHSPRAIHITVDFDLDRQPLSNLRTVADLVE